MRIFAVGAALWLASAGSAVAAGPPPPAIAQYVETLPTAGGGAVSGYGKTHVLKLPRSVTRRVDEQAGEQAGALKALATSSQFGAPQSTLRPRKHAPKARATTPSAPSKQAAASAPLVTSGSGNGSIVVLAVLLAVLTAAMIAVSLRSR
jgi:hypothetical protein